MAIYEVRIRWVGWLGAPGFNTLYFLGVGEGDGDAVSTKANAANTLAGGFATDVQTAGVKVGIDFSTESEVVARRPDTGAGIQIFNVTPVTGAGTGTQELMPTPVSGVVNWRTNVFGPRGRGRTFLPPTNEAQNTTDGVPSSAYLTAIQTAADNLIAASDASTDVTFVVWHRPVLGAGGSTGTVQSANVKSTWGVLRSRRD